MKLQQKRNEYQYLYEKDDKLKEKESIIEYGNDFINCKIIHDKDST